MKLAPLPAFADNDIRMLQDGRNASVVDPNAAAPVFDAPARGHLQLAAILGSVNAMQAVTKLATARPSRRAMPCAHAPAHHGADHSGALRQ